MATLEKIRSKAAMLVVVIGIALLAFIIGDFLNSGQSFFMMNQNKVATVNGTTIGVEEYQARVSARTEQMQAMYQQNGMSVPEGMSATIQMDVYDQMVSELLMSEELDAVGITVSDAELQDMLTGNNIHPEIARSFTNPETGVFDHQALDNYLSVIFNPEENGYTEPAQLEQIAMQRQAWLDMEKQIRQTRAYEKFMNLLSAAMAPNKVDAEMGFVAQTKSVDVAYVMQPYSTIADSTVEVSKSDLQAEYNNVKARYEIPETRTIRYIAVDVVPSADDYAKVEEKVNMLKEQFATTDDVASIVDNNSDVPYEDAFVTVSTMPAAMKNFVEGAKVGESTPVNFADDAYTMYRLMATKTAPDTVTVNLVNFAMGDTRIDSVYNVLTSGGNIDALGADVNVMKEFAVTEDMYAGLGRSFVADVFAAGDNYFKTESLGGTHVEDDANLRYIVQSGLEELIGGYEIVTACNGKEGLKAWEEQKPDIILSDIDMPEMDGYEMVKRIRETDGNTPILFASALVSPKDVKKGYDVGVNNYVKKPFVPDEMDAHIRAILKMKEGSKSRNETACCNFGHYTLDEAHATLRNNSTEKKLTLTVREAKILQLLAENKNEVVRREAILSRCWDTEDDYFASRSLDVFITKLRKIFEDDATIEIKTVRGVGLMLLVS